MTPIDWIALAVLVGSLITGMMRGFVREALSLVSWVLAFFAARAYWPVVAGLIPGVGEHALRQAAAMVIVFILVLIAANLLAALLVKLLDAAGLSGLDHSMGLFFGIVRGGIMLVMLTLLAGLTALPRSPAWHDSMVGAPAVEAAKKVIPWLPHELAVLIRFN